MWTRSGSHATAVSNSRCSPVAINIYRSLLRWTQEPLTQRVKFVLPPNEVPIMSLGIKHHRGYGTSTIRNAAGVADLIKQGRDQLRDDANLEDGFAALRSARRLTTFFERVEAKREQIVECRSRLAYRMGQVFRHKQFGYRGVIFGLDLKCERDESWIKKHEVEKLKGGVEQPFYFVIPDFDDCTRLFGSYRNTKYVAQDNVDLLDDSELCEIRHPLLKFFFSEYDGFRCRWAPLEDVAYQFAEEEYLRPDRTPTPRMTKEKGDLSPDDETLREQEIEAFEFLHNTPTVYSGNSPCSKSGTASSPSVLVSGLWSASARARGRRRPPRTLG